MPPCRMRISRIADSPAPGAVIVTPRVRASFGNSPNQTRFDQFQERLGISRNILKQRLDNLTDHRVLEKVPTLRTHGSGP